jgi:DNA modification methylase
MRKSMQQYGYLVPVILDRNNKICDGEHRVLVYKELGLSTIPAYRVDLDSDTDRKQLRQIMNKLHGQHDRSKDADEFLEILQRSRDGTLKQLSELIAQPQEHLLALIQQYHPEVQLYKPEQEGQIPKPNFDGSVETQLGDMWVLGDHCLVCGDCTDSRTMNKLLQEDKVSQLNCDPPYGVMYGEKNAELNRMDGGHRLESQYENDELDMDFTEMFNNIFKNIEPYWAEYNTFYIWSAGLHLHDVRMAIQNSGLTWGDYLLWVKNNHVLGRKDYKAKHEFCIYGWYDKHKFYAPFRTTVLAYDKPLDNDLHPTMKPLDLIQQTVTDGTQQGDIVLDTFGGSGTSLIASERTNRVWRGIELDPHYCDVIVTRWENYTGKKANKQEQ